MMFQLVDGQLSTVDHNFVVGKLFNDLSRRGRRCRENICEARSAVNEAVNLLATLSSSRKSHGVHSGTCFQIKHERTTGDRKAEALRRYKNLLLSVDQVSHRKY